MHRTEIAALAPSRHQQSMGCAENWKVDTSVVCVSQCSLHNAPIFRLLLKVAVNGTHQCDFSNFCGPFGFQQTQCRFGWPAPTGTAHAHCALARPHYCNAVRCWPCWCAGAVLEPEGSAKIVEVTLMRPIHGNL